MTPPAAFVAGWPISHSRSPLIHEFWLRRYGIAGDYRREAVPPETAGMFFRNFRASGYVGGNVTIPHKQVACEACDQLTPVARRLGAVNTLWCERGALFGDNTDVAGFLHNLDDQAQGWDNAQSAIVLGAGGAARAVVAALLDRGFHNVSVANRTRQRAVEIAELFGSAVGGTGLDQLHTALPDADLIVNATSTGMPGSEPLDIDWSRAKKSATATDLVYVPLLTPFLAGAAAAGLRTVDGIGMLLHQAVPGFERWFGVRPVVDEKLRRHILADIPA